MSQTGQERVPAGESSKGDSDPAQSRRAKRLGAISILIGCGVFLGSVAPFFIQTIGLYTAFGIATAALSLTLLLSYVLMPSRMLWATRLALLGAVLGPLCPLALTHSAAGRVATWTCFNATQVMTAIACLTGVRSGFPRLEKKS